MGRAGRPERRQHQGTVLGTTTPVFARRLLFKFHADLMPPSRLPTDVAARRGGGGEAVVGVARHDVDGGADPIREAPRQDGPPGHAVGVGAAQVVHAARRPVLLDGVLL